MFYQVDIMMEKEIKAYGDRKDTIIRFLKTDKAKLGKVYVLYPNEYEEMKTKIVCVKWLGLKYSTCD